MKKKFLEERIIEQNEELNQKSESSQCGYSKGDSSPKRHNLFSDERKDEESHNVSVSDLSDPSISHVKVYESPRPFYTEEKNEINNSCLSETSFDDENKRPKFLINFTPIRVKRGTTYQHL